MSASTPFVLSHVEARTSISTGVSNHAREVLKIGSNEWRMPSDNAPRVLMVTGAYSPVINGGVVQCRELIRSLKECVRFTVLTTSSDPTFPAVDDVDGVPVYRVFVDVGRIPAKVLAMFRFTARFIQLRRRFDVVHVHGFSTKAVLVTLLARLFRKKLLLALHNGLYDEAQTIRTRGRLAFWAFSRADCFTGVSRRLQQSYDMAGFPPEKFRLIPNMVDLGRFRQADACERKHLRRDLGLPEGLALILFVGFFSCDKCPDVLLEAWSRLPPTEASNTGLVFIGAMRSSYYDVDPTLAERVKEQVRRLGVEKRVVFVERTDAIERYYRAVDAFVLPSTREGLPVALLEAMATSLPCIATKLGGVTDELIDDGINGLLVPPRDPASLERALRFVFQNPDRAKAFGVKARATVEQRYSIAHAAPQYLETYQRLLGRAGAVA